jgi:hypothetical protein
MAAEAATPIELQFCQKCGISIPLSDIELGRARPAPGGFVCMGCSAGEVPAAAGDPAARSRGGTALLVLVALYLVGSTSFLLARELGREPVVLPKGVDPKAVESLDRKVEALDEAMRRDATSRGGALADLRGSIELVAKRLREVETVAAESGREGLRRDDELRAALLRLTDETVALKAPLSQMLEELRRLTAQVAAVAGEGAATPGNATPAAAPPPPPPADGRSREQLERERRVKEYVGQLLDPKAKDQLRYNAAVQLGDLQDPASVDPLLQALEKDPYDLVRRASAWALGRLGKEAVRAIPSLIDKIGKPEEYVAYMCECALRDITRAVTGAPVAFGCDPSLPQKKRKEIQKQWEEWWEKNRALFLPAAGG